MHLDRRQFEYTCGIVTIAFDAPVDVTGAVCKCVQCGSGRSHRSRLTYLVAGFGVADRTIGGSHKSNAGHALLCGLDWS